jgi:DNA modification methylase
MSLPTPYYDDGNGIVIYLGDCRLILPHLEPVDLVLTDPPYGIGIASKNLGQGRSTGIESTKMIYGDWDRERAGTAIFRLIEEKAKHAIIWGGNYYADVLPASQCWLVWDKRDGLPQRSYADCELAWTSFDKATRLMASRWDGFIREGGEARNGHPTQKPLELIKWAIEQAPPECMTILDPFMGSGTTLRAAKDLGRKAIGIEIEEKYCEIAVRRLQQEVLPL